MASDSGYLYSSSDLAFLLIQRTYSEVADKQSAVIRDYLLTHGVEFDRFAFSVHVGTGITPDPDLPLSIQKGAFRSTQKRIDLLAWRGTRPVIIEAKTRVDPSTLGQILTYRQLWLEENPDAPDPELVVIGRTSDDDTIRALQTHGVTVLLYPAPVAQ
ncbi:MAG TPA: hypothetical protein VKQ05_01855 [Gemmatimonadales bacterium]|nr:hypothetical protein [Gemmatimonadales bacterium]